MLVVSFKFHVQELTSWYFTRGAISTIPTNRALQEIKCMALHEEASLLGCFESLFIVS